MESHMQTPTAINLLCSLGWPWTSNPPGLDYRCLPSCQVWCWGVNQCMLGKPFIKHTTFSALKIQFYSKMHFHLETRVIWDSLFWKFEGIKLKNLQHQYQDQIPTHLASFSLCFTGVKMWRHVLDYITPSGNKRIMGQHTYLLFSS